MNVSPIAEDVTSMKMLAIAKKAAKSNVTVLINGETGVGKEVLARYIHLHSAYESGPFVAVNCAALPDNMIEAILFGYEKGAFTGAIQSYAGKFEQAEGGTLLLDEIADMPMSLQAKVLRVIQEREVERLGGKGLIPLNVRLIAATNKILKQQVDLGLFRSDLYYRLSVLPIHCAPLRERKADILPLANRFIAKYASQLDIARPTLTQAAIDKLTAYPWPGNVRELENIIHRVLILSEQHALDADAFTFDSSFKTISDSSLKNGETTLILNVLRQTAGCRELAAKKLQISARTLRYKIQKLKSNGIAVP